ncbi:hypothetical protein Emed_005196 [Eimeria media]
MPLESRLIEVYRQQVGAAVAADQKRQLVDDTKKRAIVSAGSYGAFKALVDGCHLRPLSKEDLSKQPQRRLNLLAAVDAFACPSSSSISSSSSTNDNSGTTPIGTQAQLRRQWEARGPNCDEQCEWLMQQPRENLQRLLSVDIEPQLLLQVVQALALHISGLAASRCSSCCCCCQTRTGAAAAPAGAPAPSAPAAAAPPHAEASATADAAAPAAAAASPADDTASSVEEGFCCRIAYRVSLTAGFIRFLASLQGTARGARLLLENERKQLSHSFGEALAALHAPLGAQPAHSACAAPAEANPQTVCCCKAATTATAPTAAAAADPEVGDGCCQTSQAVRMLLQAIGAPPAET